eukprot:tig00000158_g10199.t1
MGIRIANQVRAERHMLRRLVRELVFLCCPFVRRKKAKKLLKQHPKPLRGDVDGLAIGECMPPLPGSDHVHVEGINLHVDEGYSSDSVSAPGSAHAHARRLGNVHVVSISGPPTPTGLARTSDGSPSYKKFVARASDGSPSYEKFVARGSAYSPPRAASSTQARRNTHADLLLRFARAPATGDLVRPIASAGSAPSSPWTSAPNETGRIGADDAHGAGLQQSSSRYTRFAPPRRLSLQPVPITSRARGGITSTSGGDIDPNEMLRARPAPPVDASLPASRSLSASASVSDAARAASPHEAEFETTSTAKSGPVLPPVPVPVVELIGDMAADGSDRSHAKPPKQEAKAAEAPEPQPNKLADGRNVIFL